MSCLLVAQDDFIIINNKSSYGQKERPDPVFPHRRHTDSGLSCSYCHHRYLDGKNLLDYSELKAGNPEIRCANCHNRTDSRHGLMDSYHLLCMGCHKDSEIKYKRSGPRLCGNCHVKKR
ncbi:MAG: cytochrome c family protein [Spirochaetes bacterium]|nr:cytochrome c family protein [Spirochaetota bacterium]